MTVVLAFSGGLDTSFCVPWLSQTHGARVITVTVNTGGMTSDTLARVADQSERLGAAEHIEIDARAEVFTRYVKTLIRGNVLRGEVYPLCVAAERTQQALEVARVAHRLSADAVCHGSTGAGNDQLRFDVAFRVLLPGTKILTPIRELGLTREATIQFLTERNLPVPESADRYSVNRGLWGTTLGGAWTHDSWTAPPEDAWEPLASPGTDVPPARELEITWQEGVPVALDREPLAGVELIERLEQIAAAYGIGRGIHIGETVLGIKGRIGFSAAAATTLIQAHRELEKITLTSRQIFWKDHLARVFGDELHAGRFFEPALRDIEALIESSQRQVTGRTRVRLQPGRIEVNGVESPHSLIRDDIARYGEEHSGWTGQDAAAFTKLAAVSGQLARNPDVESLLDPHAAVRP